MSGKKKTFFTKNRKIPFNLKCNFNKVTAKMCMQKNVLAPLPKNKVPQLL